MKKAFAIPLSALLLFACNTGPEKQLSFPYHFDRSVLDQMVKENKAIHDISKRGDGTMMSETFYLGDTAKYHIEYDSKSNISDVYRFNSHGQAEWLETYYPNGQRKAKYALKAFEEIGPKSIFHGPFTEFHINAIISAEGEYKKNQLLWKLEYDTEGIPGDTTIFEYQEPPVEAPKSDTPASQKKLPVEKINTATSPS